MEVFYYEKSNHLDNWVDTIFEFSFITWIYWSGRFSLSDRKRMGMLFESREKTKGKENASLW